MERSKAVPASRSDPIARSRRAEFVPGYVLDKRYRIVALLGRGGMGEVYRADDLKLGLPVALKFLPEGLEQDEQLLARFLEEIKIARRVSHTNVCRVYDVGEAGDQHYLTMEYVDGEDLAKLLKRVSRLPQERAVQVAREICAGVGAAHQQGILHRDLKPANVMIDGHGRVKIADFGLASLEATIEGGEICSGTPAYMAPEQLAGREVTARSDIYSLGLVFYELFTGKTPFQSTSLAELIRLRNHSAPTRPSAHVEGLDPAVERAILGCLENEPRDRPASVLAVAAALPGADALAVALAAGETPSPEMVADAGPAGGLKPVVASIGLVVCLAGLAWIPYVHGGNSLAIRASLELPPEALTVKARELVRAAGYPGPPVDTAFGFAHDDDYLRFEERKDPESRREDVETVRPAPIYFWYRQSPSYLTPMDMLGSSSRGAYLRATPDDPPPVIPGMVGVRLDPQGRLLRLEVVPPAVDEYEGDGSEPDWSALFAQAGLDPSTLAAVPPEHNPLRGPEVRRAWRGTYAEGSQMPLRIEAAAYRGRPTSFVVAPPWASDERKESAQEEHGAQMIVLTILLLTILGVGLVLARLNLRQGRGDRAGAFRIGLLVFSSFMLPWIVGADHRLNLAAVGLGIQQTAWALFYAGVTWLVYVALEPYARKIWPQIMVSWNRLIQGRWRDPMVGRDVLVGLAAGMVGGFLSGLPILLAERMGLSSPRPTLNVSLIGLNGVRQSLAEGLLIPANALTTTVSFLFILLLLRSVLRKWWAATGALCLLLAFLWSAGSPDPVVAAAVAIPLAVLAVFILVRFGFLAAVAWAVPFSVYSAQLHTWDFAAWYAGRAWLLLTVLGALAVCAFRISLAGRPIFRLDGAGPAAGRGSDKL